MNKGARFGCLALLGLVLFAPLTARAQSDQQVAVDRALRTIDDLGTTRRSATRDIDAPGAGRADRAAPVQGRLHRWGRGRHRRDAGARVRQYLERPGVLCARRGVLRAAGGPRAVRDGAVRDDAEGPRSLLRDQFKFGAQAGIAVVNLGSGVEGAISGAGRPDIVVWSSSSGVYAGISLDGSVIRAQPDDDRAYYGRPVTTRDILFGHGGVAPHAAGLRRALGTVG